MGKFSDYALQILKERYLYRDVNSGEVIEKTPEEMFRRVAKVAASSEKSKVRKSWENKFFNIMNDQLSMPNTPTLIGAGYKDKCLSACSVIGKIPDNLDGIYEFCKYNALLTKSGVGVGQDLSDIRPEGEIIKSSGGQSAGVVNWMRLINTVAETTKQGDKARRAANMVSLRFNHPDIFSFIKSKRNNSDFTNMNISVSITDDEMRKIKNDEMIDLEWNGKKYRKVKAREIFDCLIDNMYNHGDPGVLFIDTINKNNPFNLHDGKFTPDNPHYIHTTNPCGEQPLEQFEYCNLMSIDVSKMYNKDITGHFDWDKFAEVIKTSVRFLDDIIDANSFPVEQFKDKVLGNRKIGLGLTGYADLLVKMGIRYDSDEHLDFIDKLFGYKQCVEQNYSSELAQERGCPKYWEDSIYGLNGIPMRNMCRNTQAPTGSVSTILGLDGSYGIEPYFMVCYKRRIMDMEVYESNDLFKNMLHDEIGDKDKEQAIMKECYEKGTTNLECVPEKLRQLFRCANDISADWHIKVQARMQKYIDSAISKTINAPEDDKIDDLDKRVIEAWKLGVVGMTYYRNNSLQNQTIQIGDDSKKDEKTEVEPVGDVKNERFDYITPVMRSEFGKTTYGSTTKYNCACGSFYLTLNKDENGNIIESFMNASKNGTCKANLDAVNRLISLNLRGGIKVDEIIHQLKGIVCPACTRADCKGTKKIDGLSCPDIIARALKEALGNNMNTKPVIEEPKTAEVPLLAKEESNTEEKEGICPECGAKLYATEGCVRCTECAYTKC